MLIHFYNIIASYFLDPHFVIFFECHTYTYAHHILEISESIRFAFFFFGTFRFAQNRFRRIISYSIHIKNKSNFVLSGYFILRRNQLACQYMTLFQCVISFFIIFVVVISFRYDTMTIYFVDTTFRRYMASHGCVLNAI